MLETAVEAAMKGGEALARYFEMTGLERDEKEDKTFVTKADKESELAIAEIVSRAHPDHGLLGEEGSDTNPNAEYLWVVDPLDGTANFVNGIPIFAVSVGILKNGAPHIGVVYNPITKSLYVGERGKGVTYNGKKVTVSNQAASLGLVTIGYGSKDKGRARNMPGKSVEFFKSTRLLGCAALELAYVARGGTESFVCMGLKKWDYAAGSLLVLEAGGIITGYDGEEWGIENNYFVASNPVAHDASLKLIKSLG